MADEGRAPANFAPSSGIGWIRRNNRSPTTSSPSHHRAPWCPAIDFSAFPRSSSNNLEGDRHPAISTDVSGAICSLVIYIRRHHAHRLYYLPRDLAAYQPTPGLVASHPCSPAQKADRRLYCIRPSIHTAVKRCKPERNAASSPSPQVFPCDRAANVYDVLPQHLAKSRTLVYSASLRATSPQYPSKVRYCRKSHDCPSIPPSAPTP